MTTTTNKPVTGPLSLLLAANVAEWYEKLAPMLTRYLVIHTPYSATEREDVLQDVFVAVVKHAAHLSGLSSEHRTNYVYRILKTQVSSYARHSDEWRAVHAPVTLGAFTHADGLGDMQPVTASHDWTANAQQMEQTTAARMTLQAIWQAVPTVYRDLLALIFAGHDRASIARALGVTEHAVDMRICRMRGLLVELGGKVA